MQKWNKRNTILLNDFGDNYLEFFISVCIYLPEIKTKYTVPQHWPSTKMPVINVAIAGNITKYFFFETLTEATELWNSRTPGGLKIKFHQLYPDGLFSSYSSSVLSELSKTGEKIEMAETVVETGNGHEQRYHAILHKNTDDMTQYLCCGGSVDELCASRLSILGRALLATPVHIDCARGVWITLDRIEMAKTIDQAVQQLKSSQKRLSTTVKVTAPSWAQLNRCGIPQEHRIQLKQLKFPVIMKHRASNNHKMVIAYDINGALAALKHVFDGYKNQTTFEDALVSNSNHIDDDFDELLGLNVPSELKNEGSFDDDIVVQEFIEEHGGVLFKLFAVGEQIAVQTRRSVTFGDSLKCKHGYFYFDSQLVGCKERLTISFDQNNGKSLQTEAIHPGQDIITEIIRSIGTPLNLNLFGVDVIYDTNRKKFQIIDVNYFPGFKGVPQVHSWLLDLIANEVRDSGIPLT